MKLVKPLVDRLLHRSGGGGHDGYHIHIPHPFYDTSDINTYPPRFKYYDIAYEKPVYLPVDYDPSRLIADDKSANNKNKDGTFDPSLDSMLVDPDDESTPYLPALCVDIFDLPEETQEKYFQDLARYYSLAPSFYYNPINETTDVSTIDFDYICRPSRRQLI